MFDFLKKKRSAPKELPDAERQREWDRKIEAEVYTSRAEERELEKKPPVVYYEKAVKKGKKSWNEMTHEERRKQVRERDAQLVKEYNEAKAKLKNTVSKAVKTSKPFLKQMVKDVGHAGKVAVDGVERMSDNYERHQREDDRKRARARKAPTARRVTTKRKPATKKVMVSRRVASKKTKSKIVTVKRRPATKRSKRR